MYVEQPNVQNIRQCCPNFSYFGPHRKYTVLGNESFHECCTLESGDDFISIKFNAAENISPNGTSDAGPWIEELLSGQA